MTDRQQFKSDRDLEKARKHNKFIRQKSLHDAIHATHITAVKYTPYVFFLLFIANLFQPSWLNETAVDRSVYALGGAFFGTLLSRIKEQTL
jgi:hypothetical protein